MAKDEGELPDFDDLNLPGDDLSQGEPFDLSSLSADDALPQLDEDIAPELEEDDEDDQAKRSSGDRIGREITEKGEADRAGGGLLAAISNTSPYTVMLGLALLAIVIAIFCLYKELGRYDYDIKAENRPVVTAPAIQCGPASTSAAV